MLRFFALVLVLCVPFWLFCGRPLPGAPLNLPVSALTAACPLLAALILVYREDGRGGVDTAPAAGRGSPQERWNALTAMLQANRRPAWIAWWSVATVALRVLIVRLYNNTGKSVFAAILFHDMINVSNSLFPNNGSHYDPAFAAPSLAIMAAIVTAVWGPATLSRVGSHAPGGVRP